MFRLTSKDRALLRDMKIVDPSDDPPDPKAVRTATHRTLIEEVTYWHDAALEYRRHALVSQRLLFVVCVLCFSLAIAWVRSAWGK